MLNEKFSVTFQYDDWKVCFYSLYVLSSTQKPIELLVTVDEGKSLTIKEAS